MGAQTSKPEKPAPSTPAQAEKQKEENLSLSRSLLNKIESEAKELKDSATGSSSTSSSSPSASTSSSDQVSSSRQSHLDSSIRSAISSELSRLRKQESDVRAQIQAAIEKENLDIESKWSSSSQGNKDGKAGGRSSVALQKELDEVRAKISGHDERRKRVEAAPGVKEARESVVKCYKDKLDSGRTLDCWAEVKKFREAVEGAEKDFISSLTKA